ncbi:MAG: hypothetical protein ACP5SH_07420 [Syntrophobacteraceae bacterium]
MSDQNSDERKASFGCMDRMQEMMQAMMSQKGGPCCPGMEKMAQMMMMASCCPEQSRQESPQEKTDTKKPA